MAFTMPFPGSGIGGVARAHRAALCFHIHSVGWPLRTDYRLPITDYRLLDSGAHQLPALAGCIVEDSPVQWGPLLTSYLRSDLAESGDLAIHICRLQCRRRHAATLSQPASSPSGPGVLSRTSRRRRRRHPAVAEPAFAFTLHTVPCLSLAARRPCQPRPTARCARC